MLTPTQLTPLRAVIPFGPSHKNSTQLSITLKRLTASKVITSYLVKSYLLRRVQLILITTPRQRLQARRVQVQQLLAPAQLTIQRRRPLQRVQLTQRLQATLVAI